MSWSIDRRGGNVSAQRRRRSWRALVALAVLAASWLYVTGAAESVASEQAAAAVVQFIAQEKSRGEAYLQAVGALPITHVVGAATPLLDPTDGATLGYVYELDPVGYVVVTSDMRLTPVIAFSYESDFPWHEDPNNVLLHMLRHDLALRLRAADAGAILPEAATSNESDWGALISPPLGPESDAPPGDDSPGNGGTTVYGPWLTTYWDQNSPYNDDCPLDPNEPPAGTHRCVVGCSGTALAQVLNYWQCPTAVTFPASDNYTSVYDPGDAYGTRTISIDATTASFSGLDYNNCSPTAAAAADLCFAAGVSIRMQYSSAGSGAYVAHWPAALAGNWSPWTPPPQRWGYVSADVRTYDDDKASWGSPYYTGAGTAGETSFYDQLSANMALARPAGMTIEKTSGAGHAIVVDGWQSGGRVFHLNYGWMWRGNGWYTVPSGMPFDYSVVRLATINIYPSATNYTLTTQATGSGTVSNLPTGTSHSAGTHVLVTATAGAGAVFDHWEGNASGTANPLRVIMDGNKTLQAVFRSASTSWSDDMESGQNWTATGLWHMTQQKSHSSSHSQWYGQEGTGNYETGGRSAGTLTSPAIDVSGTDSVTVSFWHWRSVFYYPPWTGQDRTTGEYSLDGGGWTQFWYEDSQDPSQYSWQQVLYDVTTTGASSLQLRFGFDTWAIGSYDDYPGWFIDDVTVFGPASAPPPTAASFRVDSGGNMLSDGTVRAAAFECVAADVAEWVPVSEPVEPGDLVELDPLNPGSYRLSSTICSPRIAGVISSEPGVMLGSAATHCAQALLALIGIVPVKVTSESGPIKIGDLLVTSSTPGHAMRWSGSGHCTCALVGKALEPMTGECGTILVLLAAH